MLVYAPDGTPKEKDPVDARECVEYCGFSFSPPEKQEKQPDTVIGLQPEPEPVVEEPAVVEPEPEPIAKTIITVDIPDTRSNEYFNAMTDEELKAYLDSNKVKYHHMAGRKTLFTAASAFANLGVK